MPVRSGYDSTFIAHVFNALRNESHLSPSRTELAAIAFDLSIEGIVVLDALRHVVLENAAATELLQRMSAESGTFTFDDGDLVGFVDEHGSAMLRANWPIDAAYATAEPRRAIVGIGGPSERRWLEIAAQRLDEPRGHVLVRLVDITLRRASDNDEAGRTRQLAAIREIADALALEGGDRIEVALHAALEGLQCDHAYYATIDEATAELLIVSSVGSERERDIGRTIGTRIAIDMNTEWGPFAKRHVVAIADLARGDVRGTLHLEGLVDVGAFLAVPIFAHGRVFGALGFRYRSARTPEFLRARTDFARAAGDLVASEIERTASNDKRDETRLIDPITRLPNRSLLTDRIVRTIVAAKRQPERFVVLAIDVAGMTEANERAGLADYHTIVRTIASRLTEALRESDTVARVAIDTFVVLGLGISDISGARSLAKKVIERASAPIVVDDVAYVLAVNVGISMYPYDGEDRTTLVDRATEALRSARGAGPGAYKFAAATAARFGAEIASV